VAVVLVAFVIVVSSVVFAEEPRREDIGDLIVLHLYGSYEEMGRQEAQLLGEDLERVYEFQIENYKELVAGAGLRGRFLNNVIIPLYSAFSPIHDESGFYAEVGGMASVLGVPRRNTTRAILSLAAGSTVFAATRSATADGQALIGRNVDWDDGFGRRRPVVIIYHPEGEDLDHISCGWPLVGVPTVGLNEAGLAISFNYFMTDPQISLFFPSWPHRRALQKARTVEEAISIITEPRRRGISAFLVLADAAGDIAMVECTPTKSAVFRPDGDWFGQANHARTPEMIQYDLYRSPDSFQRQAQMEEAVRQHVGALTPGIAAEILRYRGDVAFANASTVGNLAVLNPAVVHPASRTLWHSTAMQPHAPFGEFVPFTFNKDSGPPTFPASELLTSGRLEQERREIQDVRGILELHHARKFEDARQAWDKLLAGEITTLDTRRLVLASAVARDALGDNEGAFAVLEPATVEDAPFDTRAVALVSRGILADRLERRQEAIQHYELALAHLGTRPEFTSLNYLHDIAKRGLERSQNRVRLPISQWDTGVPQ
jgi:tetratricopeptide (TPR) repeat protein